MIILPRIKADYDDYIHFNHIRRKKIEAFYIYMYTVFYMYLQRYKDTVFTALC